MSVREENTSLFQCGVCYARYDHGEHKPKFLACHDTVCLSCISKAMNYECLRIKCPFCRVLTDISTESIDKALRTNYDKLEFMALTKQMSSRDQSLEQASLQEQWCYVCQKKAIDVCQDNNHCTMAILSNTLSKAQETVDRCRLSLANWEQAVVQRNNLRMILTSIQRSINQFQNRVDSLVGTNVNELTALGIKVDNAKLALSNFDPLSYDSGFENLANESKHDLKVANEILEKFSSLDGATVSILLQDNKEKSTETKILRGAIHWKVDKEEDEDGTAKHSQNQNPDSFLEDARQLLGYFIVSELETEEELQKKEKKKLKQPPPITQPKPAIRTSQTLVPLRIDRSASEDNGSLGNQSLLSSIYYSSQLGTSTTMPQSMRTQLSNPMQSQVSQRRDFESLNLSGYVDNSSTARQFSSSSTLQYRTKSTTQLNYTSNSQLNSIPHLDDLSFSQSKPPPTPDPKTTTSRVCTPSIGSSASSQSFTNRFIQASQTNLSSVGGSTSPILPDQNITASRASISSVGSLTSPILSDQNLMKPPSINTPPVPAVRKSKTSHLAPPEQSVSTNNMSADYSDIMEATECLSTCAWNPVENILAATKRNEPPYLLSGPKLAHLITLESDNTSTGSMEILTRKDKMHRLAWNSNGSQLATGSVNGWIHFWTSSGQSIFRQNQHSGEILAMKYNLDGKFLATGGRDKLLKVWNVTDKYSIQTYTFHNAPVWDIDWHSNKTFVSCSLDGKMFFCDLGLLSRPVLTYTGHQGWVKRLHWDPEHFLLASCSVDATIKIWTMHVASFLQDYNDKNKFHKRSVNAVEWSPTGRGTNYPNANRYLASCSDDETALILDVNKEVAVHKLESKTKPSKMTCLSFSPDGKLLATGNDNGAVEIWNVHNGRIVHTFANFGASIRKVDWERNGTKMGVAVYGKDYTMVEIRK